VSFGLEVVAQRREGPAQMCHDRAGGDAEYLRGPADVKVEDHARSRTTRSAITCRCRAGSRISAAMISGSMAPPGIPLSTVRRHSSAELR